METQGVIPQFTVPIGAQAPPPAVTSVYVARKGPGQGKGDPTAAILLVVILFLLLLIIYMIWRRRYRSKPDCGRYDSESQQACAQLSQICSGDSACLNAVAHCMPVIDNLSHSQVPVPPGGGAAVVAAALDALDTPALKSCSRAITDMDPRFVAHLIKQYGGADACIPAQYESAFSDPRAYHAMKNVLEAVAPLVPYSLAVAHALPACPPTPQ